MMLQGVGSSTLKEVAGGEEDGDRGGFQRG